MVNKTSDKKYWDKAWSLVDGCTPVSPACDHCWLAQMDWRFGRTPGRVYKPGNEPARFVGDIRIREDRLDIPLRTRKPTVFAVWSDLFHEKVPDEFIQNAYQVMNCRAVLHHTFLILTKRPDRMAEFHQGCEIAENVWHGTTVENQEQADKRIPHLLKVPGNRFLSVEPMLGPVDIKVACPKDGCQALTDAECPSNNGACIMRPQIHAVICGGESGPGARPMHPDWVRNLRDQCAAAGVPFFFKQWDGRTKTRELDGREHNKLPWKPASWPACKPASGEATERSGAQ